MSGINVEQISRFVVFILLSIFFFALIDKISCEAVSYISMFLLKSDLSFPLNRRFENESA
jgi:hypothetical protein